MAREIFFWTYPPFVILFGLWIISTGWRNWFGVSDEIFPKEDRLSRLLTGLVIIGLAVLVFAMRNI